MNRDFMARVDKFLPAFERRIGSVLSVVEGLGPRYSIFEDRDPPYLLTFGICPGAVSYELLESGLARINACECRRA